MHPFFIFLFLIIFLPACGGPDRIQFPQTSDTESQQGDISTDTLPNDNPNAKPTIQSLIVDQASPMWISVGDLVHLHATLILSNNESFPDLTKTFEAGPFKGELQWFSNNPEVVQINSSGAIIALKPGVSTLRVSALNMATFLEVVVSNKTPAQSAPNEDPPSKKDPENGNQQAEKREPEPPNIFEHAFLGPQDQLTLTAGTNGGYGQHLFPDIVYGLPKTGGTHVVSFGGGGSLLIELRDYVIVDGPGLDFTIFENPIVSVDYGRFFERAQVEVSEDGVYFKTFECNAFDPQQIYSGCAGIHPVYPLENPLDPTLSGGDSFDLAEVGLDLARYVRITDMDTCRPDDPTYRTKSGGTLCGQPGQQGFDLDAMAIVNGVNE